MALLLILRRKYLRLRLNNLNQPLKRLVLKLRLNNPGFPLQGNISGLEPRIGSKPFCRIKFISKS